MRRIPLLITIATAVAITGFALLAGCGGGGSKNTAPVVRELDSGHIGSGGQYQHTFAAPGNYGYHCTIHSNMTGSIDVSDQTPAGDVVVTITGSTFVNSVTSVRTGNKVTWVNNDGFDHTVTSH